MLNVIVYDDEISKLESRLMVVPVFRDQELLPEKLKFLEPDIIPTISRIKEISNFDAKEENYRSVFTSNENLPQLILLGAGKIDKWDMERARKFFGQAVRIAQKHQVEEFTVYWDSNLPLPKANEVFFNEIAAALTMANHKLREFQTNDIGENNSPELKEVRIAYLDAPANMSAFLEEGSRVGDGVNFARRLADLPGNILTPAKFVEEIQKLQKKYKWEVEVLHKAQLEKQGLNALLAVSAGAQNNPYLALIKYNYSDANEKIALVGKGVTFDSGGISLKPSKNMEEMKYDMCGAAAVLGSMKVISESQLPAGVIAAIPLVENLPSGTAIRPGDIVTSYSGKTVEIINTDAEGRLILADAISYVIKNYAPNILVDLATLTGAIITALGHMDAGLMSNDKILIDELQESGNITGERVWPLPIWEEYDGLVKSNIADLRNTSKESGAGAITAAVFLRQFVENIRWAHLDIAGTAWGMPDRSYRPKGATGFGVRLIYHWLKNIHLPSQNEK
jgi:leucyl aminopeptidase